MRKVDQLTAQYMTESAMRIEICYEKRELREINLEIQGACAHFPSTSNSREIAYKKIFSNGAPKTIPFIRKSDAHLAKLEALKNLLLAELTKQKQLIPFPSFLAEPVHVLVLIAHKPGRWDSHNTAKPIGDWLEDVGIINDDCDAEISCFKKSLIPGSTNLGVTTVKIRRLDEVINEIAIFSRSKRFELVRATGTVKT